MNFDKKSKIIIFTAFAVFFVIYGAFLSLGRICSKYLTSEDVSKIINDKTGLVFDIKNFKLHTTKDFSLEIYFKNLSIKTPDTKKELANLEDSKVKISILPLILKRVSLKNVYSKSLYADILMDKNGNFEFEKYLDKNFTPDFKVVFSKTDIDIQKYLIKFNDEMYSINHLIEGEGLKTCKLTDKNINLKTKANIYSKNEKAYLLVDIKAKTPILKHIDDKDFNFDIKANNINLKTYMPYLKKFGIQSANGVINLDLSTVREENKNKISVFSKIDNLYLENGKSTIKNDNTLAIKTNALIDGKTIQFDNFRLVSREIDINSNGNIKNYLSKNPKLDLNVELKDTELNNLIALVPDEFEDPDISIRNLKKYNSHAKLNGSINIFGESNKPDIEGKVDFKDVYLIKLDKRIPFAYGSAELLKTFARIDVMAFARPNEWVNVKGDFDFYDGRKGKFSIKSAENVNLEVAKPILCAVRDILDFILNPVPLMEIKGRGSIDIFVEGTKQDAKINGWFKFHDTEATLDGMNSWIKNGVGTLLFEGEKIVFDKWSATLLNNPLIIDGTASTQGTLDLNVELKGAKFSDLVLVGSKIDYIKDFHKFLPSNILGNADFKLNLKSKNLKKNLDKDELLAELQPSGYLNFNNCSFNFQKNILVKNLNGKADFGENIKLDLNGLLYNSKFALNGDLKKKNNNNLDMNLDMSTSGIHSEDIFKALFGDNIKNNFIKNTRFSLIGNIKAKGEVPYDISKLDFEKLNLEGEIKGLNDKDDNLKFLQGNIILKGKDAVFQNLNIDYLSSRIQVDGTTRILAKKINPNLKIRLYDFKFYTLLETLKLFENHALDKLLADFSNPKGSLRGNFEIRGENFKGKIEPNSLSIYSNSKKVPYTLKSGDIEFSNKNLKLKAFNFDLGNLPFYIDTTITNFATKNPLFSAKFSTILDEKSVDKFINSMLTYPVKVQGEVGVKGKITGTTNKYTTNSTITLNPNSDISYMGANIGDIENKREVSANISFIENAAKIHKVELSKYISSQNNKTYPLSMIRMSGNITKNAKNFALEPLVIKTSNPVNAKFFNVYFKKSILKQGLFNCDVKMTGDIEAPKITGKLDFKDINIPLYNLKILNADVNLNNENVVASLEGKSLDSDVKVKLLAQNKTSLPIVIHKIDIDSQVINIISLIKTITETMQNKGFELNTGNKVALNQDTFIIEQGTISAKEVKLNNTSAKNLSSSFSQGSDGILKIKDMSLDIAGGKFISNGELSLNNGSANINSEIKNCDANVLASEFLGAQNQVYGVMNGKATFKGSKLYLKEGINTIKSKVQFEILNGKMPKLGSLEYLLRAANIYKSGLLGISLNNIIELIIPYKTGEFESIKGSLNVENGLVQDIEIYSKGKSLSIFLEGSYDINTKNADIIIFGRLAKNVGNMLGFVGNASFNSLLNAFSSKKFKVFESDVVQAINKIPLIEISKDDFRIFTARIMGDINKDNYVKSFNWLN